ncbi:hypothetical protein NMY22_g13601 [Coprinellus aureogranulatus]|nr:hypothetical protein NMY22_g13601 [Coprinellus aureogranulatus]
MSPTTLIKSFCRHDVYTQPSNFGVVVEVLTVRAPTLHRRNSPSKGRSPQCPSPHFRRLRGPGSSITLADSGSGLGSSSDSRSTLMLSASPVVPDVQTNSTLVTDPPAPPHGSPTVPEIQIEPTESPASAESGFKSKTRKPKKMNISTVKFHALGHYPSTIRFFGPSDLYSTEWGENFHRSPKAWFKSTSKKFVRKELSMHERRRNRLRKVKYILMTKGKSIEAQDLREQRLASRNPDIHHYIGTSKSAPVYLSQFSPSGSFGDDIGCLHFVRNLKAHLLPRFIRGLNPNLEGQALQDTIQALDWSNIVFKDDRLYTHKIMRIKYTTYDARRDEDIIHLDTPQCNVMFLDQSYSYKTPGHPFTYGKVVGILHAEVGYVGDVGRRGTQYIYQPIEFLWVRRYRVHPQTTDFDLDEAELLPIEEPNSHYFVDPLEVLRACHLVPNFQEGPKHGNGIGKSAVLDDGSDWNRYFVNRYEWGLGVGHTYAHRDATAANIQVQHDYGSVGSGTALQPEQRTSPVMAEYLCKAGLDPSLDGDEEMEDGQAGDDDHDEEDRDGEEDLHDVGYESEGERGFAMFGHYHRDY